MDRPKSSKTTHSLQFCSFCEKRQDEVSKLIAGPAVFICNECVQLCMEILEEELVQSSPTGEGELQLLTPQAIRAVFDDFVIGQDRAKKTLAVAAYNHFKRVELLKKGKLHPLNVKDDTTLDKSNILLIGPTGCVKTLLAKALARRLNLPFAIVDATTLTEAGYVGEDVEAILHRLLQAAGGDVERAQMGIVYLDEIDKLGRRGMHPSLNRDVSGEGVQQCLLKLMEGTIASVPLHGGRKHPNQETTLVDTTHILFICGGTFAGLEQIIRDRTEGVGIGFGADIQSKLDKSHLNEVLARVETEDLVRYGLMPELVGRLPVVATLEELDEDILLRILREPKNALTRQYIKLFGMHGMGLRFDEDALRAVAKKALAHKTGARGLRAILETVLLDTMYELPSLSKVAEIVVDTASIEGRSPPLRVYKKDIESQGLSMAAHE